MQDRQVRTLKMIRSIVVHLEKHPVQPEPPLLTEMCGSFKESMTRISALWQEQRSQLDIPTAYDVAKMRTKLRRERLMPLVRIAKPLLRFAPGAEGMLRVPHARTNTVTLANHALDVAKLLTPHITLFVRAGHAKTLLEELKREAQTLANAASYTDKRRKQKARATLALSREFKKAMGMVMVTEGILMSHGADMREWRGVRRVEAKQGRPKDRSKRRKTPQVMPQ